MIRTAAALTTMLLWSGIAAYPQAPNCRDIKDSLERLRCYDGQSVPTTPAEDPFIASAKSRIGQQLLDPPSARFSDIKIKTVAGRKGLCGQVNAKNSAGGMTGTLSFTYDGEFATIMIFNPGPGNPTSMSADILGVSLGRRLEAHSRWCK